MQEVTTRTTCRVCGSSKLTPVFSLGTHYVSDFVTKENVHTGIKAPLDLEMCEDCTLVQLKHTAPQELLYKHHYWYRSGVTKTMRDALADVVEKVNRKVKLDNGDVVLDIGSNDGTLLTNYSPRLRRIGCEPAFNLTTEENYEDRGIECIREFWEVESHRDQWYPKRNRLNTSRTFYAQAKVITALGMFYDLEDPNQFIADVAKVLHKDGVFVAQLMCLKNMLNTCDVGNICHEHLEYYTLKSLARLFNKNGLEIYDITKNNVNGESYRIFARHLSTDEITSATYHEYVPQERNLRAELKDFFTAMESNKAQVVQFIKNVAAQGKRVWVYGASTKGNTILQYYGLDHTLIEGAADRSPEKHGLYTIGTGIPIYSEEYAREHADYFLVLPYAFIEEFLTRETEWRSRGGKFIVPLPSMRII